MHTPSSPFTRVLLASLFLLLLGCRAASQGDASGSQHGGGPGAGPAMADASAPSADGILIHYHAEGQGEPVLLFVHCWSCSSAFWEEQVKYFAPTHRVVTLDLAGHGASGMGRKRYTIEAFGQDVRAVAEALDLKKVVLIGHSMGGPVALEAARLMPDRVVGLVPIDTLQDADMHPTPQQLDSFLDAFKKDFPTATRNLVRQIVPPTADTKIVASIADHMAGASSEVGISAMQEMFAYDVPAALRAVKVPIKAINSGMRPTRLEVNRRYAPQFDALIMPNVGHFPMLESPDAFNRTLEQVIRDLAGPAPARG